jgi:L-asparagine transporter-like permease
MNIDEIKDSWDKQDEPELVKFDREKLVGLLKSEQSRFNRAIFWRDFREVGCAVLAIVLLLAFRAREEIVWPLYLSVVLLTGVGAYLIWYTRQWKNKEKQFSNSLCDELKKTWAQLEHQQRLLRWLVIWIYILPIFVVINLLNWQDLLNGHEQVADFKRGVVIALGLSLLVYAINWLAARAMEKEKRKVESELDALA